MSENTLFQAEEHLKEKGIILNDKIVLCTVHRRENHDNRLDNILESLLFLAKEYSEHQFVLPVHPNPNVKERVYQVLSKQSNVILTPPLDYPVLVCLMKHAKLILTDSGGIQEEAPSFGVPVLVMRYETERMEGVKAGFSKLVGADKERIITEATSILTKEKTSTRLDGTKNPYGDGTSSQQIEKVLSNENI